MLWEQGEQAVSEGSKLGARGVSWGLPGALGASWSELEPRKALGLGSELEPWEALGGLGPWEQAGVNWSLRRPWEASGLGSELE